MRGTICILLIAVLVLMNASTLPLQAQKPNGSQPNQDENFKHRRPAQARPGSTDERRAAWERLSPADKDKALAKFNEVLEKARKRVEEKHAKDAKQAGQKSAADEPVDTNIVTTDRQDNKQTRAAKDTKKGDAQLGQPLDEEGSAFRGAGEGGHRQTRHGHGRARRVEAARQDEGQGLYQGGWRGGLHGR
jgi:hypothetical protein